MKIRFTLPAKVITAAIVIAALMLIYLAISE
jgi:hypothetical protein